MTVEALPAPAAQADPTLAEAAGGTPPPPAPEGSDSPAAADGTPTFDPEREIRKVQSDYGRQLAEARRRAERAETTATQLSSQVLEIQRQNQQMAAYLAEQRRAQEQASLATLPPDRRIERKLELLEARLAPTATDAPRAQTTAPQFSPEQIREYKAARMREVIDALNDRHGLDGDLALDPGDEDLDDAGEQQFIASATALAKARARQKGTAGVAKQATDEKALEARIRAQVLQELGAGKPNAAKAAPSKQAVEAADYQKILGDTSLGVKQRREKLAALRDQARENVSL